MLVRAGFFVAGVVAFAALAAPASAAKFLSTAPLVFCAESCDGADVGITPTDTGISAPEDGLGWMHDVTPGIIEWPGLPGAAAIAASAPEPASWALLIAGFATVGAATRRRLKDAAS